MPDTEMRSLFGLFCERKKGVKGPDVHQKLAGTATQGLDFYERAWRLVVYNNFCSVPSAAVVWAAWRSPGEVLADPAGLRAWIGENWAGIPIRQNRRPARSRDKLATSLYSIAEWMNSDFNSLDVMTYEEAWESLDAVYTWGRYVKIKWLETCRRYLGPNYKHLVAPNIRAWGGWSPRAALAVIYPEYSTWLTSKRDDKNTIANVHAVAEELRQWVSSEWLEVSSYELEALLCNFRQTLSTRKTFYCGRTIDSELEYDRKIRAYWGDDPYRETFDFFKARSSTFPICCLGEVEGWDGVREDLGPLLREHQIVWSDVVYDYNASRDDLAHPVRRT